VTEPVALPRPRPASPIRCRPCGRQLATTDGERVYLLVAVIAQTVALHCTTAGCGGSYTWHAPGAGRRPRRGR
jgi:hypothetical protein